MKKGFLFFITFILALSTLLSACSPRALSAAAEPLASLAQESAGESKTGLATSTPFPSRPAYSPGELVDYHAQTGDTLLAVAVHFNTTVSEILVANPFIPQSATTLPPGMPMKIPIYYAPFWGLPYQILPDSLFVNGPAQVGFNTQEFIANYPGWLSRYREYAAGDNRSGAQIIDLVALNYSVSPRLLLALLEYQSGALTQLDGEAGAVPLGYSERSRRGLYLQLIWAANTLNNGYYGWRTGKLQTFELMNGRVERPDPWQNAASVAIQFFYSRMLPQDSYNRAIGPDGLAATYRALFGESWQDVSPHIPGSLEQPAFAFPFRPGRTWAFTGGPHTGWGEGEPFAALDFAPGAETGGCTPTEEWATAVAPGVIARSEPATVILDLDGDGDERTGWVVLYFHIATEGRARVGQAVQTGDPVGLPSCEGGRATGTHVHIARRYNGEWIPAAGPLAFNLEGWIGQEGYQPYLGTLNRNGKSVTACDCSDQSSHIRAGE